MEVAVVPVMQYFCINGTFRKTKLREVTEKGGERAVSLQYVKQPAGSSPACKGAAADTAV